MVRSTLAIIVASVVILGIPLGVVGTQLARREGELRLQRQAEILADSIADELVELGELPPNFLDRLAAGRLEITVLADTDDDGVGDTVVSTGGLDLSDPTFRAVLDVGGGFTAEFRSDRSRNDQRIALIWVITAMLAVAACAVGVGLLVRQARRLARPLEDLKETAEQLGSGDFSARAPMAGIAEIDAVADAMNHTAERLTALVAREREFSANVSHQLRTPLTAMQIRMESALSVEDPDAWKEALEGGLGQVERLTSSVEELLSYARQERARDVRLLDVRPLVRRHVQQWRPLFDHHRRYLLFSDPERPHPARVAPGGIGQALDVLLDNALQHGRGTVRVELTQRTEGQVMVSVTDDGPGVPPDRVASLFSRGVRHEGRGIGLPLAATLLAADGGRLELTTAHPPRFVIALPAPDQHDGRRNVFPAPDRPPAAPDDPVLPPPTGTPPADLPPPPTGTPSADLPPPARRT
jgi:signal transduction histidine kinase